MSVPHRARALPLRRMCPLPRQSCHMTLRYAHPAQQIHHAHDAHAAHVHGGWTKRLQRLQYQTTQIHLRHQTRSWYRLAPYTRAARPTRHFRRHATGWRGALARAHHRSRQRHYRRQWWRGCGVALPSRWVAQTPQTSRREALAARWQRRVWNGGVSGRQRTQWRHPLLWYSPLSNHSPQRHPGAEFGDARV